MRQSVLLIVLIASALRCLAQSSVTDDWRAGNSDFDSSDC